MRERAGLNLLLVVAAAAPLVATITDFVIAQGNNALRADVSRRQHAIVEAVRLVQVNQALVRQIALTAIRTHDAKLRDLLAENGIRINVPGNLPGNQPGNLPGPALGAGIHG